MPRLVLDLRGDVKLFLLAGADHEHRQLDLDLPFPVVESGRDSDEGLPLVLAHLLGPVDLALGEVQVVDVPPLLECGRRDTGPALRLAARAIARRASCQGWQAG
ncbi:MAG: hypothetical protein ACRDOH_16810 [Streptosporangiaceae bacterium]